MDFPPSPYGAEQALRELHAALEGREFSSEAEVSAFIAAFNKRAGAGPARSTRNPKQEAQDLAYKAMDTADAQQSAKLCERALKLDRDCVDALVHLARLCSEGDELIEHVAHAVKAGARALGGPEYFRENEGYFWGLVETRPYMRARGLLAILLGDAGRTAEAQRHYEEMLRLNPNDNQGVRDSLLGLYLLAGDVEGAGGLIKRYEEDYGAVFAWGRALERHLVGDATGAVKALAEARECNKHVEKYLTGKKAAPPGLPSYFSPGDENEAMVCADAIGPAWKSRPEAVEWLRATK